MSARMSVTYISSLTFDARKKIISALDRVVPWQNFVYQIFVFVWELRYLSSNSFPGFLKHLSQLNSVVKTIDCLWMWKLSIPPPQKIPFFFLLICKRIFHLFI